MLFVGIKYFFINNRLKGKNNFFTKKVKCLNPIKSQLTFTLCTWNFFLPYKNTFIRKASSQKNFLCVDFTKIQFITSLIDDFIGLSFTKCSLFKRKLNLFMKFWFFFSAILFPRQTTCSKYSVGIALGKCPFDDISSLCHWPRNRAIWNSTKIWTTYDVYDRNQLAAQKVRLCSEQKYSIQFHFFVQIVFLFSLLENH